MTLIWIELILFNAKNIYMSNFTIINMSNAATVYSASPASSAT